MNRLVVAFVISIGVGCSTPPAGVTPAPGPPPPTVPSSASASATASATAVATDTAPAAAINPDDLTTSMTRLRESTARARESGRGVTAGAVIGVITGLLVAISAAALPQSESSSHRDGLYALGAHR